MDKPDPVAAVLDRDNNTMTVAVTLRWNPEWSLDKCSAGGTLGAIRNAITAALATDEKILGFSYTCYDPHEDTDLGYIADYEHPVCAGCGKPARHVDHTQMWRAPEGYEHVEPIPADEPCDRLSGRTDAQYVIRFPNLLDVDLGRHREGVTA